MDTLLGQIVDNYKIIEVIGRGGMGVVFKALDLNLEKNVALKMIDPFLSRDENFLRRFKTEAKALAKLENHNIVSVYALRETELGLFMVMEYVQAKTVSEWLREKGKFSVKEAVDVFGQLLNAIGHAHKVGVIHRDIKPNNILLCEDGTVKVMDFGLAKVVQEHGSQSTVTQTAAGTLYYMSPEQIKGLKNVDKRSDIYSIGVTIYEMLSGRTPFEKTDSEFEIQKQIVNGKIPSPVKYNPLIPKQLIKLIMKAIDKDAEKRFQNIPDMQAALAQIAMDDSQANEKTRVILKDEWHNKTEIVKPKKKIMFIAASVLLAAIVSSLIIFSNSGEKDLVNEDNDKNLNIIVPKENDIKNEVSFAQLNIISNPVGAAVLIDGKNAGKTPLYIDSLEIKNYSIALKMDGYERSESDYQLNAGDNPINIKLQPAALAANAALILNMIPAGKIYLNNKEITSGTDGVIKSVVTAGKYKIKFIHPEYGYKETTINLNENQSKEITCYFNQKVSIQSLNNAGDAFWGTIYINGINTGKTTPGDTMLTPGTYRITVKKSGYKTVEKDIVLNITPLFEKKNQSLVFHLE